MITLEMMQKKGACNSLTCMIHELSDRMEASLPASLHEMMRWDWMPFDDREWVFWQFADQRQKDAYKKAVAPLWDAYRKAKAEALKEVAK